MGKTLTARQSAVIDASTLIPRSRRKYNQEYGREHRATLRAAGLCQRCKHPAEGGYCATCKEAARKSRNKGVRRCTRCGKADHTSRVCSVSEADALLALLRHMALPVTPVVTRYDMRAASGLTYRTLDRMVTAGRKAGLLVVHRVSERRRGQTWIWYRVVRPASAL